MRYQSIFILMLLPVLLGGCAVGQAIKNNVQGTHYLQTKDYEAGEDVFRAAVVRDRDNPQPNYYLGRFLLANDKPKQALPYLQKAASLDPRDTDYLFWQGVAYGELGKQNQERKSYQQVLKIKEKHLQALTYLGHNQLKGKEYAQALKTYEKVLEVWPYSPSALYNRSLVAKILQRIPEEKVGWLSYLSAYPSGALAIKAADHLNRLGDFSYRNHYLGGRTITLAKISFKPFSSELALKSFPSLNVVGATASNMVNGKLQVLVYQEKNKELAKARAISIKKYLYEKFPGLTKNGIGVSWFDQPEALTIGRKKLVNHESVRFFLTDVQRTVHADKKKKKKKMKIQR